MRWVTSLTAEASPLLALSHLLDLRCVPSIHAPVQTTYELSERYRIARLEARTFLSKAAPSTARMTTPKSETIAADPTV